MSGRQVSTKWLGASGAIFAALVLAVIGTAFVRDGGAAAFDQVPWGPVPAAGKNSPARTSLTAIQLECFKQQGAFYDAETERWKMTGTDNTMLSRMEAVNTCVMQKTGKRPGPFLREERTYH